MSGYWLMIFWLFAIGAATGSFLNVVVYRLPLGISLVHPPSRCPQCDKRICWHDNVPIFGWIMLRGRCRNCQNPISARYPIVEAVTAAMFAAVAAVEIDHLDIIYPLHMLLLCTLLCAGLIEHDGNRPPWRLFFPVVLAGAVVPLFWPMQLPALEGWQIRPELHFQIIHVLANLGILALVGMVWWAIRRQKPLGFDFSLLGIVLVLHWPGGGVVIAVAAGLFFLSKFLERAWPKLRVPPSMLLGIVTLAWVFTCAAIGVSQ